MIILGIIGVVTMIILATMDTSTIDMINSESRRKG